MRPGSDGTGAERPTVPASPERGGGVRSGPSSETWEGCAPASDPAQAVVSGTATDTRSASATGWDVRMAGPFSGRAGVT